MHWIVIANLQCHLAIGNTINFYNSGISLSAQMFGIFIERLHIKACVQVLHLVAALRACLLELERSKRQLRNFLGRIEQQMSLVVCMVTPSCICVNVRLAICVYIFACAITATIACCSRDNVVNLVCRRSIVSKSSLSCQQSLVCGIAISA